MKTGKELQKTLIVTANEVQIWEIYKIQILGKVFDNSNIIILENEITQYKISSNAVH